MGNQERQERSRYVDMWALPGIHPSNVEFMQKLKTADTNHFNTHMDVVGTVSELDKETGDWEKTHLIGLRTDVWKADREEMKDALDCIRHQRKKELKKQIKKYGRLNEKQKNLLEETIAADEVMRLQSDEIERRRLVLKLFKTTGERIRWCGTIEQATTTEIHNSIGSNRNLLTMVVLLPRTDFVTCMQQNHRTFRVPSVFTSGYYDESRMWNITLKRRWVSIGADYDIEVDGSTIGDVDGRLFSFGSDSYVNLAPHELADNTRFVDLLTLFSASIGYHKAMRKSLKRRVDAALAGKSHCHVIENEELRLHHNGRAAA